jgi:hypothetical protein
MTYNYDCRVANQPEFGGYDYYNHFGSGWYYYFVKKFPRFDTPEFEEWVIAKNRGDRDSGELNDVALHEVLRLAAEFEEHLWRASNAYGEAPKAPPAV